MSGAARTTKTLSLDKELVREIERTKGAASASQRVNELLKAGLEAERRESLSRETARFFQEADDRAERLDFQSASRRSLARD
jgi:hypothetical protein